MSFYLSIFLSLLSFVFRFLSPSISRSSISSLENFQNRFWSRVLSFMVFNSIAHTRIHKKNLRNIISKWNVNVESHIKLRSFHFDIFPMELKTFTQSTRAYMHHLMKCFWFKKFFSAATYISKWYKSYVRNKKKSMFHLKSVKSNLLGLPLAKYLNWLDWNISCFFFHQIFHICWFHFYLLLNFILWFPATLKLFHWYWLHLVGE